MDNLTLLSGADIPFPEAQVTIHQPRWGEIGYIGEEGFLLACELLTFGKERLSSQDELLLKDESDFSIFLSLLLTTKSFKMKKSQISTIMLLSMIFPNYRMDFDMNKGIILVEEGQEKECYINEKNFGQFKQILKEVFCLNRDGTDNQSYNPGGDAAKAIAEKLKAGHAKVAALNGNKESKKISFFSRYISILAIGQKNDVNIYNNYTVFQLYDQFDRFELKESSDKYFEAKVAGASGLDDVENWMKELHP